MSESFKLKGSAARRVSEVPALSRFVGEVHPALRVHPDAIWSCEEAFKKLLQTSFITDVLNHELALIVEDSSHLSVGAGTDVNFTVVSLPEWGLSVRLLRQAPSVPRLLSVAEHSLIGVPLQAASAALVMEDYEGLSPKQEPRVRPQARLVPRGRITIERGQTLRRPAGSVGSFIYSGTPAVVVIFSSSLVLPIRWDYDLKTLAPRRAVAGDVRASRIEFATKLLAQIGDSTSLPPLRALTQHRDHFVRWGALRAMVAIDPRQALPAIEKAARSDPHPHVAAAAAAALPRVLAASGP